MTDRLWQHRWWVLARPREHLLVDQPGHLQVACNAGRLVWPEDLCRICKLPFGVRGRLLQAKGGTLPRQCWWLPHLAQWQAVYHLGQGSRCLHRWAQKNIGIGYFNCEEPAEIQSVYVLQVNHRIAYMNVVSLMVYCHSYCCPLIVKGTLKSSIPDNLWGFFKH